MMKAVVFSGKMVDKLPLIDHQTNVALWVGCVIVVAGPSLKV